jgi:hypothetical protein
MITIKACRQEGRELARHISMQARNYAVKEVGRQGSSNLGRNVGMKQRRKSGRWKRR